MSRATIFLFAAAALAFTASPALAGPNLVQNGGFESGFTDWTYARWGTTGDALSGTTSAYTGCVGSTCIRNSDGSYDTTDGAYLYQDITTVPGTSYTLSFDYRPGPGTPNELVALFGGTTAIDLVNLANNTANTYTIYDLVASGATTRLMFLGRQDPDYDRLDNISLVAQSVAGTVPEPATWAMMLLGFGAIGCSMRFRNKKQPKLASVA